jgi:hypothetical protein
MLPVEMVEHLFLTPSLPQGVAAVAALTTHPIHLLLLVQMAVVAAEGALILHTELLLLEALEIHHQQVLFRVITAMPVEIPMPVVVAVLVKRV